MYVPSVPGKIGISLVGDYEPDMLDLWNKTPPEDKQLLSMFRLVSILQYVYNIDGVNMHKDFKDTKCPGVVLEEIIERSY